MSAEPSLSDFFSFIPEGTSAFIPFYAVHRDPHNFSPLPDAFVPERWLSPEEQLSLEPLVFKNKDVIHNTAAFVPFSFGPSNCVGKNLAMQEMRMVVCSIMQKFDIRLEDDFELKSWEDNMMDYFITLKGKLPVVLSPKHV